MLTRFSQCGPGGHERLSWCYCNVPQDRRPEEVLPHQGFIEVCSEILAADPAVHLAVWIQHPHPALLELVAWLTEHHRDRHVTIMQKRGNTAQRAFGGQRPVNGPEIPVRLQSFQNPGHAPVGT